MSRVKLESYTIRIRTLISTELEGAKRKKNKKQYEPLDSFGDNHSLINFIVNFLDSIKDLSVDEAQQRTLQTVDKGLIYSNMSEGIYSGLLESGTFGVASKGRNIDTGEITYNKTVRDSDMMPHFFLFYMPPNSKYGALILQRFGNHGISSIFRSKLKTEISKQFNGYYAEIDDLIPIEIIKNYLKNGDISELIFRNNELPKTVEGYLKDRNLKLKEASIHLKVEKNPFLNQDLVKWVENRDSVFIDIPEIKAFGFDNYSMSIRRCTERNRFH
jgi:hypothetical protein